MALAPQDVPYINILSIHASKTVGFLNGFPVDSVVGVPLKPILGHWLNGATDPGETNEKMCSNSNSLTQARLGRRRQRRRSEESEISTDGPRNRHHGDDPINSRDPVVPSQKVGLEVPVVPSEKVCGSLGHVNLQRVVLSPQNRSVHLSCPSLSSLSLRPQVASCPAQCHAGQTRPETSCSAFGL